MLAVCGGVLVVDQATKAIINTALERGEEISLVLGIELVSVRNSGIAFGLLDNGGALLLAVTAVTLAVLVGWFATQPLRPGLWLAIGLLTGGAIGNLGDRLRAGEVTDFLDLPLWPAFNLADVAITAGIVVLALITLAREDHEPRPDP
jgi:signal peptidase II